MSGREYERIAWYGDEPLDYASFRTGLTYAEVYHHIWGRNWKRRNGVLGAWREIKQKMYSEYLEQWQQFHLMENDL